VPLTFAHPAAAVPLARPLGRWGVLSALVIGSVVPDLFYILPLTMHRASSHSLAGLFWFCLPVGIAVYALFHAVLKRPLCALLPAAWQLRLDAGGTRAPASRPGVVLSILVGAVSHIVWDAFTHQDGFAVMALPGLTREIASFSNYHLYLYRVMQHLSTVVGVSLLAWWTKRWAGGLAPPGADTRPSLPAGARALVAIGLIAGATVIALNASARFAPETLSVGALQPFIGAVAKSGLQALACGVMLYSALWHVGRRLTLVRRGR